MNLDTRARASAQAIDRSATRLDPVAGLEDLLRRRRRQPLRRIAVAVALLVVVAVWAGVGPDNPRPVQPTLAPVQPTMGPVARFPVGPAPVSVAVTPDAALVLNAGDKTISHIDPRTGWRRYSFTTSFVPGESSFAFATAAGGRLWVVHTLGIDHAAVTSVDPSTGRILTHFGTGGFGLDALRRPGDLAVGSRAVWVALRGQGSVMGFDPATGELLDSIPLAEPTALATDGRTLWVATADGRLRSLDTATGAMRVRATTGQVERIRIGQGGLWLMTAGGELLRLDRRTGRVVAQVPGTYEAADLAVGAEGVWVYDQRQGAVLRIDPGANRVARTIRVIDRPLVELSSRVLALGAGRVWVVDKAGQALVRVDPNR